MKRFTNHSIFWISLLVLLFHFQNSTAQKNLFITGKIINGFTKEPVGFASIHWLISKTGVIADSIGNFSISRS